MQFLPGKGSCLRVLVDRNGVTLELASDRVWDELQVVHAWNNVEQTPQLVLVESGRRNDVQGCAARVTLVQHFGKIAVRCHLDWKSVWLGSGTGRLLGLGLGENGLV
jgi:hypothetical protein